VSKFAFVAAERANHAVVTLCRIAGASVSGFYAWLRAIPAVQNRVEAEAALRGHIGRIFAARRRVYGSPRVHAELRREGRRHARRRVARLMREMGLAARQGRRPRPRTTDRRHDSRSPRTCSSSASRPSGPTRSGSPTSAISQPTKAGSISPPSRTWPHAKSLAGGWIPGRGATG
jgi:transposase InsO family protein